MAGWNDKSNGEAAPSGTDRQHPSKAAPPKLVPILPPEKAGSPHPPDPIARNPVDVDPLSAAVEVTEARHRNGVSGPTTSAPWFLDRFRALRQSPEAVPTTTALLGSILRFKWTVLVVFALVSAPLVGFIWTQVVPKYEARAEIRIRPIIPRLAFKIDENGPMPFYEYFVNTQVSVIRNVVAPLVLDQNEVRQTRWCRYPRRSLMERLLDYRMPEVERLRDNLSVRARPRTELVDISFTDASAGDAMVIVRAIVDQYLFRASDTALAGTKKLDEARQKEYDGLQEKIAKLEQDRADIVTALKTDDPQGLIASKIARLDEKKAQLGELERRIALLQTWVSTESKAASETSAGGMETKPPYHEDEEWRKLDIEVQRIHHQMTDGNWKPDHPAWKRLEKDLMFAKDLQKQREAQLDEQWQERLKNISRGYAAKGEEAGGGLAGAAVPVEYQLARARDERDLLRKEIDKEANDFNDVFAKARKLEKADNDLRQQRELFVAVRQRREQKEIEDNAPCVTTLQAGPYTSGRPTNDRRVVFTVMALLAGLGLGGGAGYLRATGNQAILAAKDMPQPMQDPLLGHIPAIHLKNAPGRLLFDEIEQNQILLNESIRVLRTALLSRLEGQGTATVLVTSANEGTGKSSSTILLGKSIAQAGKKVLLIDADLHKMMLSTRFNLLDHPGLTESLCDKAMESLPTYATQTPGLDVMPAGKRSNRNAQLEEIANGAFKGCIRQLFQEHGYDIILLDSPPILPVADAVILAGQVDGVIMVERENVSRRTDVMAALARLSATKGHLLGTVFVGSADRDHYGYGYSYRYRRGYYGSKVKRS